jgi:hypothetical protein
MITNYLRGSGILYNKDQSKIKNEVNMTNTDTQIEELKALILEELKDCSHIHWPHVCRMQTTEAGKIKLLEMIIHHIAEEGMGIGSAIAHVEHELTHSA